MNRETSPLITFVLTLRTKTYIFPRLQNQRNWKWKEVFILFWCGIQKLKLQVVQQVEKIIEVQIMVHECIQKHILHDVNKYNIFIEWFKSPRSWKHKYKTDKTINPACHKTINQWVLHVNLVGMSNAPKIILYRHFSITDYITQISRKHLAYLRQSLLGSQCCLVLYLAHDLLSSE